MWRRVQPCTSRGGTSGAATRYVMAIAWTTAHASADHACLHTAKCGNDRVDLIRAIDASGAALDHLSNAMTLPLDLPEFRDLVQMVDRDAPVCRLGNWHLTSYLWRDAS